MSFFTQSLQSRSIYPWLGLSMDLNLVSNAVLPERGSEVGAGAGSGSVGAHFSKNGRERSVSGAFLYIYIYINIYIFKKKHVECQTRCKIYETCIFVILPI
jgi:hypothetical protein